MRPKSLRHAVAAAVGLILLAAAPRAHAELTRVDVASRVDLGASGYEKIVGTAHYTVDPKEPRNRVIVDIDKAPVNAAGRVEFSGDIVILRPKQAGPAGSVALVDVVNRGRKTIVTQFGRGAVADPANEAELGDAFLMKQGLTLVFVGWEFDVVRQGNAMALTVPAAAGATGLVRGEIVPSSATTEVTVTELTGYTPADPMATDAT